MRSPAWKESPRRCSGTSKSERSRDRGPSPASCGNQQSRHAAALVAAQHMFFTLEQTVGDRGASPAACQYRTGTVVRVLGLRTDSHGTPPRLLRDVCFLLDNKRYAFRFTKRHAAHARRARRSTEVFRTAALRARDGEEKRPPQLSPCTLDPRPWVCCKRALRSRDGEERAQTFSAATRSTSICCQTSNSCKRLLRFQVPRVVHIH